MGNMFAVCSYLAYSAWHGVGTGINILAETAESTDGAEKACKLAAAVSGFWKETKLSKYTKGVADCITATGLVSRTYQYLDGKICKEPKKDEQPGSPESIESSFAKAKYIALTIINSIDLVRLSIAVNLMPYANVIPWAEIAGKTCKIAVYGYHIPLPGLSLIKDCAALRYSWLDLSHAIIKVQDSQLQMRQEGISHYIRKNRLKKEFAQFLHENADLLRVDDSRTRSQDDVLIPLNDESSGSSSPDEASKNDEAVVDVFVKTKECQEQYRLRLMKYQRLASELYSYKSLCKGYKLYLKEELALKKGLNKSGLSRGEDLDLQIELKGYDWHIEQWTKLRQVSRNEGWKHTLTIVNNVVKLPLVGLSIAAAFATIPTFWFSIPTLLVTGTALCKFAVGVNKPQLTEKPASLFSSRRGEYEHVHVD